MCLKVYNFGKDAIITGIEIFHLKRETSYASWENIYDIVITTSAYLKARFIHYLTRTVTPKIILNPLYRRLYEFIGSDSSAASSYSSNSSPSPNVSATMSNNAPIFASIFQYYESKNVNEIGTYIPVLMNLMSFKKIDLFFILLIRN